MSPPPTLKLDDVHLISQGLILDVTLCNVFGIFKEESTTRHSHFWVLKDETRVNGVRIKLCGDISNYPKAKTGDIIRIHRLSFDRNTKDPIVSHARNVVLWHSHQYEPTPITIANTPTICDDDIERRRTLEDLFCSMVHKISELTSKHKEMVYCDVAGRLDEKSLDSYGNMILKICDGTGEIDVRVFPKRFPLESEIHHKVAVELKLKEYIIVTNVKYDHRYLNLSANTTCGKSIRSVERSSILGVLLSESLVPIEEITENGSQSAQGAGPTLRRSPRLLAQQQSPTINPINNNNNDRAEAVDPLSEYTKIAGIKKEREGFYNFYDIAGQVRSTPNETKLYSNWVFQLYDGSTPNFTSFYSDEVKEPVQDCFTILVYSNQKPGDTDAHINSVKSLHEGDLVAVKNVKASWKEGKLKLEMNANLKNGKSINVIEKDSQLGISLLEVVTNPIVEELLEDDYATPPETY